MSHFKVVVLTALIADILALPVYDRSSYGRSAQAGVIYAQDVGYGRATNLGYVPAMNAEYARALNAGYARAAIAEYAREDTENLGYTHASRFGHSRGSAHHVYDTLHNYVEPNYEYSYDVNDAQTNDIKEQAESRVGDKVDGHYSVVEPDGTTRTVQYSADDRNGFNAVVTRHGDSRHLVTTLRTHDAPDQSHVSPLFSYMQHYKYSNSRPGGVVAGSSYAFAPGLSPDYVGSHNDAFSTPPVSHSVAPAHGYGGPFTANYHAKKRLRHAYGGYY